MKININYEDFLIQYTYKEKERMATYTKNKLVKKNEKCISNYYPWQKYEYAILNQWFPMGGAKEVQSHGVKRSLDSIKQKARALNLQNKLGKRNWTKEEDDAIRKWYPLYGPEEVINHGVQRSEVSIKGRASKLKIQDKRHKWTISEDEILKDYYPSKGPDYVAECLGRSRSSVSQRAAQLNVNYIGKCSRIKYTKEEDEKIIQYYPLGGAEMVAQFVNRDKHAIGKRAKKLGLKFTGNGAKLRFTDNDDKTIKQMFGSYNFEEIALHIGKTEKAIRRRSLKLGLRNSEHKNYTKEDDEKIRALYPSNGSSELATMLGRTEDAIKLRARRIGVKREPSYHKKCSKEVA